MKDSKLRQIIVSDRERIQRLMLTDQEAEVLNHFSQYRDFSSFQVSAVFCFQPSHSSMVMKKLFDKGYVKRRLVTSPSGGNEYQFEVTAK